MKNWICNVAAGLFFALAVASLSNHAAFAAKIIAVEKARAEEPAADSGYTLMDRVEEAVEPLRALEYTAAMGFGSSGFQGALTIGYLLGPYVVLDTTGFYSRESDETRGFNLRSGINTDLTLRLGRRTGIMVPFGGTGVGFERWDQNLTEGLTDGLTDGVNEPISKRDDNATVSQFIGLAFRLTPNMQLSKLTSRWLTWLDNPPFDLATRFESKLSRRERRMDLGVGVVF